jgi:hypothetical protein
LKKNNLRITILAMIVVMGACRDRNPSAAGPSATGSSASSSNPATAPATQKWLGQWNGPEGTYLVLSQNGDKYVVKIRSLDSLDSYDGVPSGDRIQFVRNGKPESVHAGNGEETGMKWLLDKKNCLIIKSGEGFCRD